METTWTGLGYVAFTILVWGIVPVFDKIGALQCDSIAGVFVRGLTVFATAGFALLVTGKFRLLFDIPARGIGILAFSAFLAGGVGTVTYFRAMQEIRDAGKVSALCSTYPLVAMIFGFLILGEKITGVKILGSLFIAAGIILLNF